jgi:hypothetical protein
VYAKVSQACKLSERSGGFSDFEEPPPEIAARNDQRHHRAALRITEDELVVRIEGLAPDAAPCKTIDHFVLARRG